MSGCRRWRPLCRTPACDRAMREPGSTEADILKAYPRMTAEMVRLAPGYAQTYPMEAALAPLA
jgi:hypothetical protein